LGPNAIFNAWQPSIWFHLRAPGEKHSGWAENVSLRVIAAELVRAHLYDEAFADHFLDDSFRGQATVQPGIGDRSAVPRVHDYYSATALSLVIPWKRPSFRGLG